MYKRTIFKPERKLNFPARRSNLSAGEPSCTLELMLEAQQRRSRLLRFSLQSKKVLIFVAAAVILIAGISAVLLVHSKSSAQSSGIPNDILTAANFPLYIPEELPKGYALDSNSYSSTREVVSYTITYNKDSKLLVSLQPIPANFDFDTFYEKSMKDASSVSTSVGNAKIGRMNGIETISLLTKKTWVLITAPDGAADRDMSSIVKTLRYVSPK
jgi:hypothetical protein